MVAQGEAQAEGQAQPWESDTKKPEAPKGRQNRKWSVAPSGLSFFSLRVAQGSARVRSLHPGLPSVAAPRLKTRRRFETTGSGLLLRTPTHSYQVWLMGNHRFLL